MLRVLVALVLVSALFVAWLAAPLVLRAEDEKPAPDDPRVATVRAVEGAAYVRPGGARRWTPLRADALLLPGDEVKVATRGANALELALPGGGNLVLGPGSLVEFPSLGRIRLLAGELEAEGGATSPLQVDTADGVAREVTTVTWLRVRGQVAESLEEAPRWLRGYRATVGDEWMGSLVAEVDGRNVPLSVGYHKVTVDVRDQIARTTVEQSFVNATDQVLEGVFYFPLPADASISGFGMWIGNELVEADLVEKARARQIYEDILRRKKDPGLLEWQGGNLFKARVYPITPHAEKRIRIRYTQVLELEGSAYRYRYALRSDLLRANPLRRLDIQVNVASARPLAGVACPSHAARIRSTAHEAQVTFDAEEFVPQRDFEVRVSVQPGPAATAIATRRGEDGTFAVFLNPPEPEVAGWKRDLTPDGQPLDVVLLADTSGSMDDAARATQRAFLDAFISQLGDEDRVRLFATDVAVEPLLGDPRPGGSTTAAEALASLDARASLGWTDLDAALKGALAAAGPETLVIYVGDGIPSTGDADPNAQADRLRRLGNGASAQVHAVATSSTYEQVVLDAMASLGGSVRRADDDPVHAARALLAEAVRPALRDLRLTIEGARTARVYPETLANLPLGTQRIVLGRYLPTAEAQQAEVVLEGTLEGEAIAWRTPLVLPARDSGNDFLPRLWARRHLDHLLAQGASKKIQAQIVAFSRRFGIITPYTSFLVLESDEERERYGVERTVRMRDGEAFFAEGRDQVALEMTRQATQEAEAWRVALRRRMLREIAGLGRDLLPETTFVALGSLREAHGNAESEYDKAGEQMLEAKRALKGRSSGGVRGGWGAGGRDRGFDGQSPPPAASPMPTAGAPARRGGESLNEAGAAEPEAEEAQGDFDLPMEDSLEESAKRRSRARRALPASKDEKLGRALASRSDSYAARKENLFKRPSRVRPPLTPASFGFPGISLPPATDIERPLPAWTPEALAAIRSLDRRDVLASLPNGLRVVQERSVLHPVRGDELDAATSTLLVGPNRWAVDTERRLALLDADRRLTVDPVRDLGRMRARVESDARRIPFPFPDRSAEDLVRAWRDREIRVEAMDEDLARLVVDGRTLDEERLMLTIDRRQGLLQESRRVTPWGRTLQRRVYGDVVTVHGIPFATTITTMDARGRVTQTVRRTIEALDPEAFDAAFQAQAFRLGSPVWLGESLPSLAKAKAAMLEGEAPFDAQFVVLLDLLHRSQNEEALALWSTLYAALEKSWGRDGLDASVQRQLRRGPELMQRLDALASANGEMLGRRTAAYAAWVDGLGAGVLGPRERLALLTSLEDLWRAGGPRDALRYDLRRIEALQATDDLDAVRALREQLLEAHPTNVGLLLQRAADLVSVGRWTDAASSLEAALAGDPRFTEAEFHQLYTRLTDLLWSRRDMASLGRALDAYVAAVPAQSEAWRRRTSYLYATRRMEEGDAFVLENLAAPVPTSPDTAGWARMQASVEIALGNLWFARAREIHPTFQDPLVAMGLKLGLAEAPSDALGRRIAGDYLFGRTDGKRRLVDAWRHEIVTKGASLPPLILSRLLGWVPWSTRVAPEDVFQGVFDLLATRYTAAGSAAERRTLGNAWEALARARGDAKHIAQVLRARRDATRGAERRQREAILFDHLLTLKWDEATEKEIASLLPTFLDTEDPKHAARVAAVGTRRFAKWVFEGRREAAMPSTEERKQLSRAAGRAAATRAIQEARRGLVTAFGGLQAAAAPPLRAWLTLERLGYGVELGEDLAAIEARARELLDAVPTTSDDPLDAILAERTVLVLDYAATRRGAEPEAGDRTEALLRARLADPLDERLDWHYELFRLLLALDREEALETTLRAWIEAEPGNVLWRTALGQVLAASGRLADAAVAFEAASAVATLAPAEYESLATWYLVLGDDARREAAQRARYDAMGENELATLLYQAQSRMQRRRGGVPPDFDPSIVPVLRALLAKATTPANYLWRIQRMYEAVRDHRLLEPLVDGIGGHTPEAAYGCLLGLQPLVASIHEEATVDQTLAHLTKVREGVASDVDRRALDLFDVMLSARAAQVPNADPAFAPRALEALKAAWKGSWVAGERRYVAQLLSGLGRVQLPALAEAQLARLAELDQAAQDETVPVRLAIAQARARALAAYGQVDAAVDVLTAALDGVRPAPDAPLPPEGDGAFEQRTSLLAQAGHFQRAESLLLDETGRRRLASRRLNLEQRRIALVAEALRAGGSMRAGTGTSLLDATTNEVRGWLETRPADEAARWVQLLVGLYQSAAKGKVVGDAGARLYREAGEHVRPQLDRLALESAGIVNTIASALAALSGPYSALEYALEEQSRAPAFLARLGRDPWSAMHWSMAKWRQQAGQVRVLEDRLLPLVKASLDTWLRAGRRLGSGFWQPNDRRFWNEKRNDFAATAGALIELAPDDVTAQHRAASYLRSLGRGVEAIAALAAALDRGAITDAGRLDLARWRVQDSQFAAALPVLEALRETQPDQLESQLLYAKALHGLKRDDEALRSLGTVEARQREKKRWGHGVAAALGRAALEFGYLEPAQTWMEEAIRLREEQRGRSGGADGTLGGYFGVLAKVRAGLGRTDAAVDAASAAVVAWGRNARRRGQAVEALIQVLVRAETLDAWVETYEARVDAEGVDAPILRKAIATAYQQRNEPAKAVPQWLAARELAPEDASIHQALVALLDELGRREDAIAALLESLRMAPRNLDAAADLARRYTETGNPTQAERARTNLAEALPHEAAGHRRLAALLADAGRTEEAVVQWQQVVRTDPLDPTGWLDLGAAALAAGQRERAREAAEHVLSTAWEDRFKDVKARAAALLEETTK